MKVLSIFNHYRERGGEAAAVNAMKEVAEVAQREFLSADWTGKNAPTPWKQAWWMLRNPTSPKLPLLATIGNEKGTSSEPQLYSNDGCNCPTD